MTSTSSPYPDPAAVVLHLQKLEAALSERDVDVRGACGVEREREREKEKERREREEVRKSRKRQTSKGTHRKKSIIRFSLLTGVQAVLEQLLQRRHGPLHDLPGRDPVDQVRREALDRAQLRLKELDWNRWGRSVGRGSCFGLLCARSRGVVDVDGGIGAVDVHGCHRRGRGKSSEGRTKERRGKERREKERKRERKSEHSILFVFVRCFFFDFTLSSL